MRAGWTTADGLFTLEDVECLAACTEAPAIQVNYRYRYRVTADDFDTLVATSGGRLGEEVPPFGTLARVRQRTTDSWAGAGAGRGKHRWTPDEEANHIAGRASAEAQRRRRSRRLGAADGRGCR